MNYQSPVEPRYPSSFSAWYAVAILTMGWTLAYLDRQIIAILIESLRGDLGISDTQASLVQGMAFSLFFVVAGIPLGSLVDRYNRRNILLFGVIFWSLMTVACGLASNFEQLFIARMGVGVGEACLAPASMSLISDLVRPQRRGMAMGLMVSGTALGAACSIFVGGLILDQIGAHGHVMLPILGSTAAWQVVFFSIGAPGILLALLVITIREPQRHEQVQGASAGSFIAELRKRRATFALVYSGFAFSNIVGYGVAVWSPVVLLRIHGLSPGEVGAIFGIFLLTLGPLGTSLGGMMSDAFAKRYGVAGRFQVALIALAAIGLTLLAWVKFGSATYSIWVFVACGPLFGGIINGTSYPGLTQLVANNMRGKVIALFLAVANLAGLGIAPTAIALLTDYAFKDPARVKDSIILITLPAATIAFILLFVAQSRLRKNDEGHVHKA